jgi:hypothetical protein
VGVDNIIRVGTQVEANGVLVPEPEPLPEDETIAQTMSDSDESEADEEDDRSPNESDCCCTFPQTPAKTRVTITELAGVMRMEVTDLIEKLYYYVREVSNEFFNLLWESDSS